MSGKCHLCAVHLGDPLQEGRVGRYGDAGTLEQAEGHVLVAAQTESQRRRAGDGVAEHADEGGDAHLIQGAVDDIVVLVEDDMGADAVELALQGREVPGQVDDDHVVAQAAQRAGHAADHLAQVAAGAVVAGRGLVLGVLIGVVQHCDSESFHATFPMFMIL